MTAKAQSLDSLLNDCNLAHLLAAFDLLKDTLFWIKDTESRIIYANVVFLEHIGIKNLAEVRGLTDYDFAPKHIAEQFILDDKLVMKGEIIEERLETNILTSDQVCWFMTSKRPIINRTGHIVGSYGISRHLEKTSFGLEAINQLKIPIDHVRKNYMNPINISELAEVGHLSVSALERRFKKYLSKTPKQFINDIRLENARRLLLDTNLPIATIALETGFSDASYFTRMFSKSVGKLPSEFRLNYRDE